MGPVEGCWSVTTEGARPLRHLQGWELRTYASCTLGFGIEVRAKVGPTRPWLTSCNAWSCNADSVLAFILAPYGLLVSPIECCLYF